MHYFGITKKIVLRPIPTTVTTFEDMPPLISRIYQARGIQSNKQLDRSLKQLPSPWLLSGMEQMVVYLQDAITQQKKIIIVADFDADGATSCALAVKGLTLLGARPPEFIVPNRFEYGYGLTPEIVALALKQSPEVLITVDNGISSISGVATAKNAGLTVLVTDHHLPGDQLPDADAIVNPNLPGDEFPGGALAGVGVMFYILMALRQRLREHGHFGDNKQPNLGCLLDYVALGTVADVVALDHVNRILVHQGLQRIRSGNCHAGISALIEQSGRNQTSLKSSDLGFSIGPRLNAAGRLDDMTIGIQCLLTDDENEAKQIARQMDELNSDRRMIEEQMKQEAFQLLDRMQVFSQKHVPAGLCLYDENWHQGVIGILASRIKDRMHRPVIAFAPAENGMIKGSARSINGVHIRDVLCEIAAEHPKILEKFGGHAMAAGLSLHISDYPPFALAFEEVVAKKIQDIDLEQVIYSDGELKENEINLQLSAQLQQAGPWGQQFAEPLFNGIFDVVQSRVVGGNHLKLVLRYPFSDKLFDAIAFNVEQVEQWLGVRQLSMVYQLDINDFRGNQSVQFIAHYLEKIQ